MPQWGIRAIRSWKISPKKPPWGADAEDQRLRRDKNGEVQVLLCALGPYITIQSVLSEVYRNYCFIPLSFHLFVSHMELFCLWDPNSFTFSPTERGRIMRHQEWPTGWRQGLASLHTRDPQIAWTAFNRTFIHLFLYEAIDPPLQHLGSQVSQIVLELHTETLPDWEIIRALLSKPLKKCSSELSLQLPHIKIGAWCSEAILGEKPQVKIQGSGKSSWLLAELQLLF